jgi:hypothetical protein
MAVRIAQQLVAAADLLRPRTFLRTLARVDQLSDRTRALERAVEALLQRTSQLETIARLDWELQGAVAKLGHQLDPVRIGTHVRRAVAGATLATDPCPYIVVENWLPRDVYDTMVRALPPPIFFTEREMARQRLAVPFSFGPTYSRRVWDFIAAEIVGRTLRDAIQQKFEGAIRDYVCGIVGSADGLSFDLEASDGRIMLRRPGYVIAPHRDPKWGFVTGLVYLARQGDVETHGTRIYRVRDDEEAPTDKPYYVDEERCELVTTVPFRANTLVAFLNSTGAHGASIPADAQPPNLERYLYQFRLGPSSTTIQALLGMMSSDRQARWAGAKQQRADRHS